MALITKIKRNIKIFYSGITKQAIIYKEMTVAESV
jgi:hypothetical protein